MSIDDIWLFLRKDYQDYTSSLDSMKQEVLQLVKEWADKVEIIVNGNWDNLTSISMKAIVWDKDSKTAYEIDGDKILKGKKINKSDCTIKTW